MLNTSHSIPAGGHTYLTPPSWLQTSGRCRWGSRWCNIRWRWRWRPASACPCPAAPRHTCPEESRHRGHCQATLGMAQPWGQGKPQHCPTEPRGSKAMFWCGACPTPAANTDTEQMPKSFPRCLPQDTTGGNRPKFLSIEYPSVLGEPGISEDTAAHLCFSDKPVKSWSLGQGKRGGRTGVSAAMPRSRNRGH